jgi:putative hemolysin
MAKAKPAKSNQLMSFFTQGATILFAGLIIVGAAFLAFYFFRQPAACTMEARICPDGSTVGRSGPNCEFAECPAGIANPASVFCAQHGGRLSIVDGPSGQQGICTLSNGSACDEWEYYRGICGGDASGASACSQDSDCVPAAVCHPSACINQAYIRPNGQMMCTMVCMGPLDCGAGSCGCVGGKCAVIPATK